MKFWQNAGIIIYPIFLLGIEYDNFGQPIIADSDELFFDDILQSNFKESHHNLVEKDYQLLKYFQEKCSHANFVFKGDDDILLNPSKAIEKIRNMIADPDIKLLGCLKVDEFPNTDMTKKYYVPPALWVEFEQKNWLNYMKTVNFKFSQSMNIKNHIQPTHQELLIS